MNPESLPQQAAAVKLSSKEKSFGYYRDKKYREKRRKKIMSAKDVDVRKPYSSR